MTSPDHPPVADPVGRIARFSGAVAILLAAACGGTTPVAPTAPVAAVTLPPAAAPVAQPAADPAPAPSPAPSPAPAPTPTTVVKLAAFTISPQVLRGGDPATGTVTLDSVAPAGGAVVNLSSEGKDGRPPDTVTVPAGAKSADVTINTASVSADTEIRISASAGGVTITVSLRLTKPGPPAPHVINGTFVTVRGIVG